MLTILHTLPEPNLSVFKLTVAESIDSKNLSLRVIFVYTRIMTHRIAVHEEM